MKLDVKETKRLMASRGIDIKTLASLIPCTVTALYIAFKRERTKLDTIQRMADILGINPKDLLI